MKKASIPITDDDNDDDDDEVWLWKCHHHAFSCTFPSTRTISVDMFSYACLVFKAFLVAETACKRRGKKLLLWLPSDCACRFCRTKALTERYLPMMATGAVIVSGSKAGMLPAQGDTETEHPTGCR